MNYSIDRTDDVLVFSMEKLVLKIWKNGAIDCSRKINDSLVSPTVNSRRSSFHPFTSIRCEDIVVDNFKLVNTSADEIVELFGPGVQFCCEYVDTKSVSFAVSQKIFFSVYDQFPDTITVKSCFYLDDHSARLDVKYLVLNSLLLDSRRFNGKTKYDIWVYNGSGETREHCLQELTPGYYKRNYLGVPESYDGGRSDPAYRFGTQPGFGGGVPLNDLWSHNFGVSVGHLETKHKPVSIPVLVQDDGEVLIEIHQPVRDPLTLETPLNSITTFITLHDGDFFNGLERYREMMAASGVIFPEATKDAYEPLWDTWGFKEDFKKEDILSMIPHLKEMGIHWITLDDRWYDNTGDWMPREDTFPGGEEEFKDFIKECHRQGIRVKLWTLPAEVDGAPDLDEWLKKHPRAIIEIKKHPYHSLSRIYHEHPDWIVRAPDGSPELSKRGNYFSCGSIAGVLKHYHDITVRMFRDWKIDGLKQDAIYICPACYDKSHNHRTPDEASEMYGEIMRVIYETARHHNPHSVIMNCPCGTPMTPDWIQWQNQPITMDPWTSWVNRGTVKSLKGLTGPRSAVVLDHVEISDEGSDFSTIGTGGVPETRIVQDGTEGGNQGERPMTFEEKKRHWKKWINLYREHMLASGEYLNLYDFIYDTPEIHVIRKHTSMYYGIYPGEPDGIVADKGKLYNEKKHTKRFAGTIELRGLSPDFSYSVYDYENDIDLGIVKGSNPYLIVNIHHHLLIKLDRIEL